MKTAFYYLGSMAIGVMSGYFAKDIPEAILLSICGVVLWSGLYRWSNQ